MRSAGTSAALATSADLYDRKAFLIIGADLAQRTAVPRLPDPRQPAASRRACLRGHARRSAGRSDGGEGHPQAEGHGTRGARRSAGRAGGRAGTGDPVQRFGQGRRGSAIGGFGQSLGIPVRYCPLVDYSNSRGAIDMGLVPELLPGYEASNAAGMTVAEMLAAEHIDGLWVVGANPLKDRPLQSRSPSWWCRTCS